MEEQTFILNIENKGKVKHTNLIFKRERIDKEHFLEFGKHKKGNYEYISLLKGDIDYYGNGKEINQELFFISKIGVTWRILSYDLISYIKNFKTKEGALKELIKLIH